MREIWSRHDRARSGLPLLQLGIALKTMGDAPRGDAALKLAVATPRGMRIVGWAITVARCAITPWKLALLEENKLLPEVQNQLLSTLSEEAYGQRWLSTQKPTPCSLPDVRWRTCRAAGRRKPRCRRSRWPATKRKPAISTAIGWRRCR